MLMLTDRRKRRMALSPDKKEAVKMRNTEGDRSVYRILDAIFNDSTV